MPRDWNKYKRTEDNKVITETREDGIYWALSDGTWEKQKPRKPRKPKAAKKAKADKGEKVVKEKKPPKNAEFMRYARVVKAVSNPNISKLLGIKPSQFEALEIIVKNAELVALAEGVTTDDLKDLRLVAENADFVKAIKSN
jgi:hypothetical protein